MNIDRYHEGWEDMYIDPEGAYVLYSDLEPLLMAVKKVVECKGRFHTEQNFKALAAEWEKAK